VSIRSTRRRLAAMAVVVTAGLALSACGGDGETAAPGGDDNTGQNASGVDLVEDGKIKTCTSLPYPPFQFDEGGEVVGFDVDMVDLVAEKLGVEQEIIDVQFDVIRSGAALNAGECDIAAAGMTITEERKANLDFSVPYFDEVIALLVNKGSGVSSLDDVKAQNLRLGVQAGTTSLDYAEGQGMSPTQFDDAGKQLLALQSNQVDVILQDLPVVNDWLKRPEVAEKYELATEIETGAQYGFGMKKGNTALVQVVDEALKAAMADGTWEEAYVRWMGSEPESTPAPQS
jgi:polar amino acid transport system substrate-binding protein